MPSALLGTTMPAQKPPFFSWQGWNLWNAYSLPIDSITNKGQQTNLVTCELFPVAMTSFRSAGSLMLEPLMNIFCSRQIFVILFCLKKKQLKVKQSEYIIIWDVLGYFYYY